MKTSKYVTALLAAAVLGLTGCSSSSSTGDAETIQPGQLTQEDNEEIFLEVMKNDPYFEEIPDDMILDLGNSLCDALDEGSSVEEVFSVTLSSGVPAYQAGYLIGGATSGLCPEYVEDVDSYFKDTGGAV